MTPRRLPVLRLCRKLALTRLIQRVLQALRLGEARSGNEKSF